MANPSQSVNRPITEFQTNTGKFSGRAGASLISRYLHRHTGFTIQFSKKKNGEGTVLKSFFHLIICLFFAGTDFPLRRFDQLKKEGGYAGVIETPGGQLVFEFRCLLLLYPIDSTIRIDQYVHAPWMKSLNAGRN